MNCRDDQDRSSAATPGGDKSGRWSRRSLIQKGIFRRVAILVRTDSEKNFPYGSKNKWAREHVYEIFGLKFGLGGSMRLRDACSTYHCNMAQIQIFIAVFHLLGPIISINRDCPVAQPIPPSPNFPFNHYLIEITKAWSNLASSSKAPLFKLTGIVPEAVDTSRPDFPDGN